MTRNPGSREGSELPYCIVEGNRNIEPGEHVTTRSDLNAWAIASFDKSDQHPALELAVIRPPEGEKDYIEIGFAGTVKLVEQDAEAGASRIRLYFVTKPD